MHTFYHRKAKFLTNANYEEITVEQVKMLNNDWLERPHLRFLSSQLLAGALLVDQSSSIIINTMEPYSRDSSIDAHFGRRLTDSVPSSPEIGPSRQRLTLEAGLLSSTSSLSSGRLSPSQSPPSSSLPDIFELASQQPRRSSWVVGTPTAPPAPSVKGSKSKGKGRVRSSTRQQKKKALTACTSHHCPALVVV